jgi:hypothetical protein
MTSCAPDPVTVLASLRTESADAGPHAHHGPRRRWLGRLLALVLAIAATATGVGACGAGRNILGTSTSPCFPALPVAKQAVEGRGSFDGVRLVNVATLTARRDRGLRELLDMLPIPSSHQVCLVAYTGSYRADQVELPFGPVPPSGVGRYAIAVVTIPKSVLLGTFVVQREPLSFKHEHLGS